MMKDVKQKSEKKLEKKSEKCENQLTKGQNQPLW